MRISGEETFIAMNNVANREMSDHAELKRLMIVGANINFDHQIK